MTKPVDEVLKARRGDDTPASKIPYNTRQMGRGTKGHSVNSYDPQKEAVLRIDEAKRQYRKNPKALGERQPLFGSLLSRKGKRQPVVIDRGTAPGYEGEPGQKWEARVMGRPTRPIVPQTKGGPRSDAAKKGWQTRRRNGNAPQRVTVAGDVAWDGRVQVHSQYGNRRPLKRGSDVIVGSTKEADKEWRAQGKGKIHPDLAAEKKVKKVDEIFKAQQPRPEQMRRPEEQRRKKALTARQIQQRRDAARKRQQQSKQRQQPPVGSPDWVMQVSKGANVGQKPVDEVIKGWNRKHHTLTPKERAQRKAAAKSRRRRAGKKLGSAAKGLGRALNMGGPEAPLRSPLGREL